MIKKTIYILLFIVGATYAQQSEKLKQVWDLYSDFNYQELIKVSNNMLSDSTLTNEEKIELYLLKGISQYSLNNLDSVRKNFIEILNINSDYKCSASLVPPKIIAYYESVKTEYKSIIEKNRVDEVQNIESSQFQKLNNEIEAEKHFSNEIKSSLWRSVLLPGTGHLYAESSKGWFLTGASLTLLGGGIYYYANTYKLEKEYLNESDWELIEEKYKKYNSSYKLRNALIAGYALIWLYAQYDILFGEDFSYENMSKTNFSLKTGTENSIYFCLDIPLN